MSFLSLSLLQVYDVTNEAANKEHHELAGAMLTCVINKHLDEGSSWTDLLSLIVAWRHVGTLKHALRKLRTREKKTVLALEDAFHQAFLSDEAEMCELMLRYHKCSSIYDLRRRGEEDLDVVLRHAWMLKQLNSESVCHKWAILSLKSFSQLGSKGRSVPAVAYWNGLLAEAQKMGEVKKLLGRVDASWRRRVRGSACLFPADVLWRM